ncbi:MAG: CNNM domain-containing protein [Planctomycetota bacterium]
MTLFLELLALFVLLALSATYSGSETGFYSVSPLQVEIDVKRGSRRAALVRWLLRDEAALLVTILVGNNLALELATHLGEDMVARTFGVHDPGALALLVTATLTPLVFLFGEALPKDLFRQRPHALTGLSAPVIGLSRIVFWPLERALRSLTLLLERALGLEANASAPLAGRDALRRYFEEGRRHGALGERAESLAQGALRLRTTYVEDAMVPWDGAECLLEGAPREEVVEKVRGSRFSRILVVARGEDGAPLEPPRVVGYVHQLEVLHGERLRERSAATGLDEPEIRTRPLWSLDARATVGRALEEFSAKGRRIATVEREGAVVGLVSVNDLLDVVSSEVVA